MYRQDFPVLKTLTYLDSAAGALKPRQVVKAMNDYYLKYPINTRSNDSRVGSIVTQKIIAARASAARLIDAQVNEVIFTSGTTDGLNRISKMLAPRLKKGDEILLSYYNHSSNILPFLDLAKATGAKVVYAVDLISAVNAKTKIISAAQVNNTIQIELDWAALFNKARLHGAILINDAAQAIGHTKVSLALSDVVVFSSNKLYGPTGCGVLAVKHELLKTLHPAVVGSSAVAEVTGTTYNLREAPDGFEPGTLNVAGIIGLGAGIDYYTSLDLAAVGDYEHQLASYAFEALSDFKQIHFYSRPGDNIIIFNIGEYHAQDVVAFFGSRDIILRGGVHCAKVLAAAIDYDKSIRLSVSFYNNKADIDTFITVLKLGLEKDFLDLA